MVGPDPAPPVLEVRDLEKEYGSLRPLRIRDLKLMAGELTAVIGLDGTAAEMLTNLLVGAHLPDRGHVLLFGRDTASITDGDEWLRTLDRVGIFTKRTVVLDNLTVMQNLAVPLTLEVDPIPPAFDSRLRAMAEEVDLDQDVLDKPIGTLPPDILARVRLARALAFEPELLLIEHATAAIPSELVEGLARIVHRAATRRRLAVLAVTSDTRFGAAIGARVHRWQPSTGALVPDSRIRSWFA